jgi:hypothetical protein
MFDHYLENFSIPFETFMLTSNFAGLSDLQIKDSEIFNLARKFERRVQENISAAQTLSLNINFDRLQNKIKQFTAVGAAKKLSNAEPQTGFEELAAIRKLELSFESLVVEEEFAALFDRNTKQHAMEKLKKYEYSFSKKDE